MELQYKMLREELKKMICFHKLMNNNIKRKDETKSDKKFHLPLILLSTKDNK